MAKNGCANTGNAKRCTKVINVLVVGECGDGKSTLINALRDPTKSEAAVCGKCARGVTKDIVLYPCCDINGTPFNILDTPGVGDHDVRPTALVSMIEEFLKTGMVPGGVRGVVVTTPVPDGRIRLGAQIVQAIVDEGFVAPAGEDKYGNIILCGTKADKADDDEKESFMNEVKPLFFEKTQQKTGPCVIVDHKDYSPLLKEIAKLPAMAIDYVKPEAKEMAAALARTLGLHPDELQNQIEEMRRLVETQSHQLKGVLHQIHEETQRHREELAKKDEMIQHMMVEIQDFQCKTELARLQREVELEELRQEQDENQRMNRQEAARRQEFVMRDMKEQEQRRQEQMARIKTETAARDAEHRQAIQQMQAEHRQAMEAARANRQSGSSGACEIL